MSQANQAVTLKEKLIDALIENGFGVLTALELVNTVYLKEIRELPAGKHTYSIGKIDISFTKI